MVSEINVTPWSKSKRNGTPSSEKIALSLLKEIKLLVPGIFLFQYIFLAIPSKYLNFRGSSKRVKDAW